MNAAHFGDPLNFHLVPPSKVKDLVCPILCFSTTKSFFSWQLLSAFFYLSYDQSSSKYSSKQEKFLTKQKSKNGFIYVETSLMISEIKGQKKKGFKKKKGEGSGFETI